MNILKKCFKIVLLWSIFVCFNISCTQQAKINKKNGEETPQQNSATFIKDSVMCSKIVRYTEKEIVWKIDIELRNTSKLEVFINDIVVGCKCIKYRFSKKPFIYNETSKLAFYYSSEASNPYFNKRVLILLNNGRYFFYVNLKNRNTYVY